MFSYHSKQIQHKIDRRLTDHRIALRIAIVFWSDMMLLGDIELTSDEVLTYADTLVK